MRSAAWLVVALAAVFPRIEAAGLALTTHAARRDLSQPLHFMPYVEDRAGSKGELSPHFLLPNRANASVQTRATSDAAQAPTGVDPQPIGVMPPPIASFEGLNNRNNAVPPDTVGEAGPNHYVQWINRSLAIWDKQGTLLFGPMNGRTIWSGFGGVCETSDNGDPIVQYDALADRWLLSQLAWVWPIDFHQCIAVSQTPDPTGAYYRYDYPMSTTNLNDYPKFGVWPDAYYMAINEFNASTNQFRGQGAIAFERAVMLAGGPARMIRFNLHGVNPKFSGALPADLDGPVPPPEGASNTFVAVEDDAWGWPSDRLMLWKFHVDWSNPAQSTFGVNGQPDAVIDLALAGHPFDANLCNGSRACLAQPGGSKVDAMSGQLMYRLAYRNFGDHESLVVNHTVDVNGADHAGVRWYEIRDPGGTPTLHQAGTFAPDAAHRWMGSAAMDGSGNLALAYSVSGTTVFPSIHYAGRLATDPLGTLPRAEATLMAGSGYQTGASRWGDYSSLALDPTDDCTFWYTQEYYTTTSGYGWQTRIGSFRFDSCVSCRLVGDPDLRVAREGDAVTLLWSPDGSGATYDVFAGLLSVLISSGGDLQASAQRCIANDLAATSIQPSEDDPALGDGYWYLARATLNGCVGGLGPAASQASIPVCP